MQVVNYFNLINLSTLDKIFSSEKKDQIASYGNFQEFVARNVLIKYEMRFSVCITSTSVGLNFYTWLTFGPLLRNLPHLESFIKNLGKPYQKQCTFPFALRNLICSVKY